MSINAVSNGNSGISPYQTNHMHKHHHAHHAHKHHHTQPQQTQQQKAASDGSALLAAVDAAFRSYIAGADAQHQAMIDAVAGYALSPNGKGASPVSKSDIAPFLALNVMA